MALLTVQRSLSTATSPGLEENRGVHLHGQSSGIESNATGFLTLKGAALFIPGSSNNAEQIRPGRQWERKGELHRHLEAMFNHLEDEDYIKLTVCLESNHRTRLRYLTLVNTRHLSPTEQGFVLGYDFSHQDSPSCTVGLVLPLHSDTMIHLDGDGGFIVTTDEKTYIFKPVSVQAMWTALQCLHRACEGARRRSPALARSYDAWLARYSANISSDQNRINKWNVMLDLVSVRLNSPKDIETESERVELLIRSKLREIVVHHDLENVTSRQIRLELEQQLNRKLTDYRGVIDNELIILLGQMDSPSKIFDHVYLGSEWNASNLEDLQSRGVKYILNVTREIDNFFPAKFEYHNVRVYDIESSDLLSHWKKTYNFINKACKQRHNKLWRSHSVGNLSENVLPVSQSPTQPGMPCDGQSDQNLVLILPKPSSEPHTTEVKAKTRPKSWSPEMSPLECFGFKPICPSLDFDRTWKLPNSDTGDLQRCTSWATDTRRSSQPIIPTPLIQVEELERDALEQRGEEESEQMERSESGVLPAPPRTPVLGPFSPVCATAREQFRAHGGRIDFMAVMQSMSVDIDVDDDVWQFHRSNKMSDEATGAFRAELHSPPGRFRPLLAGEQLGGDRPLKKQLTWKPIPGKIKLTAAKIEQRLERSEDSRGDCEHQVEGAEISGGTRRPPSLSQIASSGSSWSRSMDEEDVFEKGSEKNEENKEELTKSSCFNHQQSIIQLRKAGLVHRQAAHWEPREEEEEEQQLQKEHKGLYSNGVADELDCKSEKVVMGSSEDGSTFHFYNDDKDSTEGGGNDVNVEGLSVTVTKGAASIPHENLLAKMSGTGVVQERNQQFMELDMPGSADSSLLVPCPSVKNGSNIAVAEQPLTRSASDGCLFTQWREGDLDVGMSNRSRGREKLMQSVGLTRLSHRKLSSSLSRLCLLPIISTDMSNPQ
uniref:protein phosphatase Slingshot homolog 2-like isoform X2 n=1 Tax=Myxine glutinosa TaxID=7769 RepID=UPI00358FA337